MSLFYFRSISEGLDLVIEAIDRAGYNGRIKLALNVAATDFCFGMDFEVYTSWMSYSTIPLILFVISSLCSHIFHILILFSLCLSILTLIVSREEIWYGLQNTKRIWAALQNRSRDDWDVHQIMHRYVLVWLFTNQKHSSLVVMTIWIVLYIWPDYPIVSITQPFDKDDWESTKVFTALEHCQVLYSSLIGSIVYSLYLAVGSL